MTAVEKPDVCDFCDSPKVARRYQCMDFDAASADTGVLYREAPQGPTTNVVLASKDYWAACDMCSKYIDEDDIDGLVAYVVLAAHYMQGDAISPPVIQHLRHTYKLFFQNRIRVAE